MIHFLTPILQPYRIDFYEKLNKYYNGKIIFHFGSSDKIGRSSYSKRVDLNIQAHSEFKLKFFTYHLVFWKNFIYLNLKKNDTLLVQPILGNISVLLAIILAKIKGVQIIFWVCAYEPKHNYFFQIIKNTIIKFIYSLCDKAICYSNFASKYCILMGLKESQITIAYNGIDKPEFKNKLTTTTTTNNIFKLGYIGALIPEKGISLLLQSTKFLKSNYTLQIIGDGELYLDLKYKYRVNEKITFFGKSFNNERFLSNLDLLIIPGQGGLSSIESIFQNTYVLCSEDCDPAVFDVIIKKKNGEFFKKGLEAKDLAKLIDALSTADLQFDDKYGKDLVIEKFTTEKMFDVFIQTINIVN